MKKVLPNISAMQFASKSKLYFFSFSSTLQAIKKITLTFILLICCVTLFAQTNSDTTYQKVIEKRSTKIVEVLNITKKKQYKKVHQLIVQQYYNLNTIHNNYSSTLIQLKSKQLSIEENTAALKDAENTKKAELQKLHPSFINALTKKLSSAQVEKVKDGMTYSVVPKTWAAYKEMLPNLTQEQKGKMYAWLIEARELAMDEGTSDKKHAVFGKYKGKINNYLSAAGYDMKKEGEEWAKRIKAAKEIKQTQN